MRNELPIRAVCERESMAKVVWSHLIANPNLVVWLVFCAVICLTAINAVRYFPTFGETVALLEPF
jgi:hypothetical protein